MEIEATDGSTQAHEKGWEETLSRMVSFPRLFTRKRFGLKGVNTGGLRI
jgi:hypothetical protein